MNLHKTLALVSAPEYISFIFEELLDLERQFASYFDSASQLLPNLLVMYSDLLATSTLAASSES